MTICDKCGMYLEPHGFGSDYICCKGCGMSYSFRIEKKSGIIVCSNCNDALIIENKVRIRNEM